MVKGDNLSPCFELIVSVRLTLINDLSKIRLYTSESCICVTKFRYYILLEIISY